MNGESGSLADRVELVSSDFAKLATAMSDAADRLRDAGEIPSSDLVDDIQNARAVFATVLAAVVCLARHVPGTPIETEICSIRALRDVVSAIGNLQVYRTAMAVLDRARRLAASRREGGVLLACAARAGDGARRRRRVA